jgi:EamA domain-containing membrane protein RarD
MESFLLVLTGGALSAYSVAMAFGWGRRQSSVIGTIIALGLSLMFCGYWLVRNTEGGPLVATCVKVMLGLGASLLILLRLLLRMQNRHDIAVPTGYLLAVGCLSAVAFFKFRDYTKEH